FEADSRWAEVLRRRVCRAHVCSRWWCRTVLRSNFLPIGSSTAIGGIGVFKKSLIRSAGTGVGGVLGRASVTVIHVGRLPTVRANSDVVIRPVDRRPLDDNLLHRTDKSIARAIGHLRSLRVAQEKHEK